MNFISVFTLCVILNVAKLLARIIDEACTTTTDTGFSKEKLLGNWNMIKRKSTGAKKFKTVNYAWHVSMEESDTFSVRQTGRFKEEGVLQDCFNKSATMTLKSSSGELMWTSPSEVSDAEIDIVKMKGNLTFAAMCIPKKDGGKCGSFVLSRNHNPSSEEMEQINKGISTILCEEEQDFEDIFSSDVDACP